MLRLPSADLITYSLPSEPWLDIAGQPRAGSNIGMDNPTSVILLNIAEYARVKKPRFLVIEGPSLVHDFRQGTDFRQIMAVFHEASYHVQAAKLDSSPYLPQVRSRLFMVFFRHAADCQSFRFPSTDHVIARSLANCLQSWKDLPDSHPCLQVEQAILNMHGPTIYLDRKRWGMLYDSNGARLWTATDKSSSISEYWSELPQRPVFCDNGTPRYLTSREVLMMQGFPENIVLPACPEGVTVQYENALSSLAGGSVSVPVAQAVLQQLLKLVC